MAHISRAAGVVVAALAVVALAGCATGGGSADPTDSGDARVLKAATLTGVLPYSSLDEDGETVIGYEPDLLRAAAERIGATVEYTILDFDSLLPGIDSGRFDVVQAGFADKPERQAKYDMLDVTNDKFTLAGMPENAEGIETSKDLCGHSVGSVAGGAYVELFEKWNQECTAAGLDPITIQTYDSDSQGFLAVKSGQTDFWPSQIPVIATWAEENDGAQTPLTFFETPSAFILAKDSPLTAELQEALQAMVDDGTYAEILEKWKVPGIARDEITVNAGTGLTE